LLTSASLASRMGVKSSFWTWWIADGATKSICVSVRLCCCSLTPFCFLGTRGLRLSSRSSRDWRGTNWICVNVCWRGLHGTDGRPSPAPPRLRCLLRGLAVETKSFRLVVRTVQGLDALAMALIWYR
jgi:hypothetical protein